MDKSTLHRTIIGDPPHHKAGLQDDWWTQISPNIWASRGSYLKDQDGSEYLDLCGFFSTAPVCYDHPLLRDPSFVEAIGKLAIYRPSISDFWIQEMADFIDSFRSLATPLGMDHLFFIDGGSLAVENALKAAFDWKVRRNMAKGIIQGDPQEEKRPLGTNLIHFESAFHGRSGYTLSLTHTVDARKYKYFPKFDWFRINPPVMTFDNQGRVTNADQIRQQHDLAVREMEKILTKQGDDVAAIIIEPIQCEGGDRHIPTDFFVQLRKLADEHDVILIYDEVQTGFGTTGKMWCHEYFGQDAKPDVIIFSKKAQVGGIMASYDRFSSVDGNVFGNGDASKSRLNSTWGGNPVDMLRCTQFLRIIDEDHLLDNAQNTGQYFLDSIRDLCRQFDHLITNPRGRGMLLAFDACEPSMQGTIWEAFRKERLLSLTCGDRTVRFRPHLDLTRNEISDALERMSRALSSL